MRIPAFSAVLAVSLVLPALAREPGEKTKVGKVLQKVGHEIEEVADDVTRAFDRGEATVKTHVEGAEVTAKKAIAWEKLEEDKYKALVASGEIALPNGKKVKSKHFFAAVNHVGKALASIGSHLVNDAGKAVMLGRHVKFDERMKVATASLTALHKPVDQFKKLTLDDVAAQQKELLSFRATTGAATEKNKALAAEFASVSDAGGKATRVSLKKPWELRAGEKKHVGAYVTGQTELWGDATGTGLHTEARAGGHLLHDSRELLFVKADFNAPKSGELEIKVDASVQGKSVFSFSKKQKDALALTQRASKEFDVSATVPVFSLGIVHVVAKMGFTGTAGVDFGATLAPGALGAHLTPFVKATTYVQAAVELAVPVAEAGARGELTLVEDEMQIAGHATLIPAQVGGKLVWGVYTNLGAHNSLHMLDGAITVFAKIHYPCLQDAAFKICTREVHHPILESKGIKLEGDLFREVKFTPLGALPKDFKI